MSFSIFLQTAFEMWIESTFCKKSFLTVIATICLSLYRQRNLVIRIKLVKLFTFNYVLFGKVVFSGEDFIKCLLNVINFVLMVKFKLMEFTILFFELWNNFLEEIGIDSLKYFIDGLSEFDVDGNLCFFLETEFLMIVEIDHGE